MNRATLLLAVAIALPCVAQPADVREPLTIKGVTPGDPVDKISQIGVCTLARGGICFGNTQYGQIPNAHFTASYVAGKITDIGVTFDPSRSREVFDGLTKRFGESTPTGCKEGVPGCHTWQYGGARMMLIETVGAVTLRRAAPADGY